MKLSSNRVCIVVVRSFDEAILNSLSDADRRSNAHLSVICMVLMRTCQDSFTRLEIEMTCGHPT